MKTLLVEDAGISHSGNFIGNDATFSNFLLLAQLPTQGKTICKSERGRGRKNA
jgi:hypothetical protein